MAGFPKWFVYSIGISAFFSLAICKIGEVNTESDRSPRFFPFFLGPTHVRFPNDPCVGENGLKGTCYSRHECSSLGGTASGTCAKGLGCCCIIKRTCEQSTKANCTYFTNPEYPDPYVGTGTPCKLTIWKTNKWVCQLRLDFIDMNLAEPDANGHCLNDFMYVTGAGSNFPTICGLNTGEHAYIDFLGDGPICLVIDTNTAFVANRRWKIKITQVKCCDRAPVGCLMYYTATSGKVMSFNYSPTPSTMVTDPDTTMMMSLIGTREIANLNYGVCIRMAPGYCSIEWSQNPDDRYSFTVTGNASTDADLGMSSQDCDSDFVIIPNPSRMGQPLPSDRFCGLGFPTVVSSSKPFVMTVVTNYNETTTATGMAAAMSDEANRGFCLNYRQLPCV